MSAAITAAAVGVAGSAYSANQQKKAGQNAANAANAGSQLDWERQQQADAATWQQRQEAQKINQAALNTALGNNRINQSSDFGSVNWSKDPDSGAWSQQSSIAPEQKAMLDQLRGQQGTAIGGMESGFNVNNDVMKALQGQTQPLMQQQRDRENARLAAMGLSTGSGEAWGTAQDVLNRSENDMNQKNVLGGFSAWNQEQANNRANLGALNSTETGWKNNSAQTPFQTGQAAQAAQIQAPGVSGDSNAFAVGQYQGNMDLRGGNADANALGQITGIVGGLAGNQDLTSGVSNWWNGTGGGTVVPGATAGSTGTGFDLGSGIGKNSMSGFYTDPWGAK